MVQPALQDEPVVLEGFWDQVWPKIGRKPEKTKYRIANKPLRNTYEGGVHKHVAIPGGYTLSGSLEGVISEFRIATKWS